MSKIDRIPFRSRRIRLALALVAIALFVLFISSSHLFRATPARAQEDPPNFQPDPQDPCLVNLPAPSPLPLPEEMRFQLFPPEESLRRLIQLPAVEVLSTTADGKPPPYT